MTLEGACFLLEKNGPSYLSASVLWDQMLPSIVPRAAVWGLKFLAVIPLTQMVEVSQQRQARIF